MNHLPYYKWNVQEQRKSIAWELLDLCSRGIVRELLDWQWVNGSLPDDHAKLALLVRATDEEWGRFAPFLDEWFPASGGNRANPALEDQREETLKICESRKRAGSLGGKSRKPKEDSEASGDAESNQVPSMHEASPKQMLSKTKAIKNKNKNITTPLSSNEDIPPSGDPPEPLWFALDESLEGQVARGFSNFPPFREQVSRGGVQFIQDQIERMRSRGAPDDAAIAEFAAMVGEWHAGQARTLRGAKLADLNSRQIARVVGRWLVRQEAEWRAVATARIRQAKAEQGPAAYKPTSQRTVEENLAILRGDS